ncbi:hypothetical protein SXCC_03137 [Gluconacetobacter sp. SXCC-1]|nr:hypothetical protein SXCC_03137 [Gluconacetobacter sp. SXCC-1]
MHEWYGRPVATGLHRAGAPRVAPRTGPMATRPRNRTRIPR